MIKKNKNIKRSFKSEVGKFKIIEYYEALIERWKFPHEEIYVNTSYGKTFIIACGEEYLPPLIVLHGSGMNSVMMINDIEIYSQDYRVYAIDIPGEPGKSYENQISLKGDDFSNWLNEVFNNLSITKANIVGLSLGGWLGIKFSIKYYEKVEKLVLLCPAGVGPQKNSFIFKSLFYTLMGDKGLGKLYYKINGNKPVPEIILNYQKLIAKHVKFRKEIIPIFSDNELKNLKIPISLFVGGEDIIINSKISAKRLDDLVKNADINFFPNEGHSLMNKGYKVLNFLNKDV